MIKKVLIHSFDNSIKYQIVGGHNKFIWKVSNAFFVVIISKFFIRIFFKKNTLQTLSSFPKKYSLFAFGLFSIKKKSIYTKPIIISKQRKKFKKITIKNEFKNLKQPHQLKHSFKTKNSFSKVSFKNKSIKILTLKP